ncbi:hypothetical protein PVNG_02154 [Plasmodium vivax North Korean]|uniref:Variable surface protein Vir7-like protein n=1 Tax=Plasmodium vivax North Korean TaxID=1035514 RepID=A0A0J9TV74_PLAVI|nr:hypothetical protein PVNG_02154 [Plasmodium vivax North Korean]
MSYDATCKVAFGRGSSNYAKYKDFCMNLMRNLGAYSSDQKLCNSKAERCKTLNNWLYYVIIDQKVPTDIISIIFNKSKEIIDESCNTYLCGFSYDEKIKEPKKIIKLLNLIDNVNIFYNAMIDRTKSDYCFCEKYIYECVDIYKNMSNLYCSKDADRLNNNKSTCDILTAFKDAYISYLYTKEGMSNKIPSLTDDNTMNLVKCESKEQKQEFQAVEGSQPSSSKSLSTQTIVGTMAGASSVLALLYKVNISFLMYIRRNDTYQLLYLIS